MEKGRPSLREATRPAAFIYVNMLHFKLYKERCDKADIPMAHWAIPWDIWKAMEEEKEIEKRGHMMKKKGQQLLDFKSVVGPRESTRARVLELVAKLIATNNQVRVSMLNHRKFNP